MELDLHLCLLPQTSHWQIVFKGHTSALVSVFTHFVWELETNWPLFCFGSQRIPFSLLHRCLFVRSLFNTSMIFLFQSYVFGWCFGSLICMGVEFYYQVMQSIHLGSILSGLRHVTSNPNGFFQFRSTCVSVLTPQHKDWHIHCK